MCFPTCDGQDRSKAAAKKSAQKTEQPTPSGVPAPNQVNYWIGVGKSESVPWCKSSDKLLVIVGIITFLVIGWQSYETRKAATASQRSVKTLINSERAWVLVDVDQSIELTEYDPGTNQPHNRFRVTLKNSGRTVARLRKFQETVFCVADDDVKLPDDPVYWPQDDFTPERCGILAPTEKSPAFILNIGTPFTPDLIDRMKRGVSSFHIFGRLEYFDFEKELRVLQFCYRYTSERDRIGQDPITRWVLSGTYNSHT
jgi:hypothetical protein